MLASGSRRAKTEWCIGMADHSIDVSQLPEDVREKLAELDLELSEGECAKQAVAKFSRFE